MKGMNILTGLMLLLGALVGFGAAGYLGFKAYPDVQRLIGARFAPVDTEEVCVAQARTLAFMVDRSIPGQVVLSLQRLNDPVREYAKASTAAMACEGYELEYFCAGKECGENELVMRLSRVR